MMPSIRCRSTLLRPSHAPSTAVAPLLSQTATTTSSRRGPLRPLRHPYYPDRLLLRRRKYRIVHSKRRHRFLNKSSDYRSQECLRRSREFKKGLLGEERAEVYVRKGKAVEILPSFGGFKGKVENVEDLVSKLQIRDQVEEEAATVVVAIVVLVVVVAILLSLVAEAPEGLRRQHVEHRILRRQ